MNDENPLITMGFWPGGDRDGNPNVTAEISMKVADALRTGIIKCYYLDVRRLKRRLTFKGVESILNDLEAKLYNNLFIPDKRTDLTQQQIVDPLYKIREIIVYQHNSLFLPLLDNLISKVQVFGLHFAALDFRQDSSIHALVLDAIAEKGIGLPANYASLSVEEKMNVLTNVSAKIDPNQFE